MSLSDRLSGLRDRIGGILEDFTNLEVSTIVRPGMTAQKMPSIPHALHDLADEYASYLQGTCGVRLTAFLEVDLQRTLDKQALRDALGSVVPKPDDPPFDRSMITNEWRTYWALRYAARWSNRQPIEGPHAALQRTCVERIKSSCDQIFGLLEPIEAEITGAPRPDPQADFSAYAAWLEDSNAKCQAVGLRATRQALLERQPAEFDFSPRFRTVVRKAWELGLEQVLMQTIVQLDGDVMTRMTPEVAEGLYPDLNSLHLEGVTKGISVWKLLLDVIQGIARIVAR